MRLLLATLSLVTQSLAFAPAPVPGPQVVTFRSEVDGSDQPYGLYIPANYTEGKRYPLVIALHGAGSNHRLALRRVFGRGNLPGETDTEATRHFPALPPVEYLVATPLGRGTMGYQGIAEQDVYDVLADVKRRFSVDEDRVFLTGYSMGGGGTMWLGLTRPDLWAAIAPVCPAMPGEVTGLLPNALDTPVRIFHGELDPVVPVQSSRQLHKQLLDLGTKVSYIEYPTVRHNSWDFAYRNAEIFRWFDQFHRNPYPTHVRYTSPEYRYRQSFWVQLDRLRPGTMASIDAQFTSARKLTVTTKNLDAFTLRLKSHPSAAGPLPLQIVIDGKAVAGKAKSDLAFHRTPQGWAAGAGAPAADEKRPGLEGPIHAVVDQRHVYVYGTKDQPAAEERERRRQQALQAADWSSTQSRLLLSFAVLADDEVSDAQIRDANMVLFGTRETNLLIDRYAAKLPLSLNTSAADYGLLYAVPVEGKMALISSGLPWWAGNPAQKGWSFIPETPRMLRPLPDFVVFRGSLDHILASGYFDTRWKLTTESVTQLQQTGAVQVR